MVVAAKVLGRIIITRIWDGIDDKLRQEQAGFRKGRGTTEQNKFKMKYCLPPSAVG